MIMTSYEGLFAYAPFLVTYGPLTLAAIFGAMVMNIILKLAAPKATHTVTSSTKSQPAEQSADEDNLVFLDSDVDVTNSGSDGPGEPEAGHIPYKHEKHSPEVMIQRSRAFYEEMNKRRSVRFFSEKPIPREVVDNIVRAAGTSPSGAHTEPWTFVAIWDRDTKAEVRAIIEAEEEINYRKRMGDTWVNDLKVLNTNWEKPYLETAPCLLLVLKQSYGVNDDGTRRNHYYNELSTAIAAGIILSAVQMAGLVTLTSTPMNAGPRLRILLNRPINEKVILLLPIGYAADDATVPAFKRKPLEDILINI